MEMKRDAKFSEDRKYRWVLEREWEEGGKLVTFIMLNPSCADEVYDDQTIKRCITFAKKWQCGRLRVVNLFARIATKPKDLAAMKSNGENIVGLDNDDDIRAAIRDADFVVCAWGNNVSRVDTEKSRIQEVLGIVGLEGKTPYYLGSLTVQLQPPHPLRLSGKTELVP